MILHYITICSEYGGSGLVVKLSNHCQVATAGSWEKLPILNCLAVNKMASRERCVVRNIQHSTAGAVFNHLGLDSFYRRDLNPAENPQPISVVN